MVEALNIPDHFGPDGYPIAVLRRNPQPPFPRHTHQFTELVIVTDGSAVHVMDDYSYAVGRGDVFVIQGDHEHEYRDLHGLCLANVIFQPGHVLPEDDDLRGLPGYRALFVLEPAYRQQHRFASHLCLAGPDLARAETLVDALEEELSARRVGFRLSARGIFFQLVGHLARSYGQALSPQAQVLYRISEAIHYLEEHLADEDVLAALPGIAHMSRRNFQRAFRKAMHTTAVEYLNRLRVKRASEMLRQGELTIAEIGYRVGFGDSNYFSRVFRRITSTSPREYRRQFREES